MSTPVRVAAALGLIVLCALSVLRVTRPPRAIPSAAPDTVFSAERAMRDVDSIAIRPHPMGSADHDRVRDYIVERLATLGVHATLQATTAIGTRYQEAGHVENVVASVPGSGPAGKAVLLVAHYDGVGAGPAASDDGSGVAALLETVRALEARKQPLTHDVYVLFTDGEEAGLLGAAAFAREHPWAKNVGVALNFDARGTSGRSFMFETGPNNLSTVAALRTAGDVTAGSVFTAIYRVLPNDTDLSELAVLGIPAMNFAFASGVLRYHTGRDDPAHLNPGSLQHQGEQMLALARTFGTGPLPLARTGDATFFDVPFLGMVVYPQWMAYPLVAIAAVFVGMLLFHGGAGMAIGFGASLAAVIVSSVVAWFVRLTGPAAWSGVYAAALVAFVLAINALSYAVARGRSDERSLHVGALVLWLLIAIVVTATVPGAGYLFTWPLLFAAIAARSRSAVPQWVSAIVALAMLAGFAYAVSVVMLGVVSIGAVALALLVSLIAWLLLPLLAGIAGSARWGGAPWLVGAAVLLVLVGIVTVHPSAALPTPTNLIYAENADSSGAWLGVSGSMSGWARGVIANPVAGPAWTARLAEYARTLRGRGVARVPLGAPTATLVHDTIVDAHRRLDVRVGAPRGTTALVMHVPGEAGAHVSRSAIDGRVVDTSRYRSRTAAWVMQFWAVPDSGSRRHTRRSDRRSDQPRTGRVDTGCTGDFRCDDSAAPYGRRTDGHR